MKHNEITDCSYNMKMENKLNNNSNLSLARTAYANRKFAQQENRLII